MKTMLKKLCDWLFSQTTHAERLDRLERDVKTLEHDIDDIGKLVAKLIQFSSVVSEHSEALDELLQYYGALAEAYADTRRDIDNVIEHKRGLTDVVYVPTKKSTEKPN